MPQPTSPAPLRPEHTSPIQDDEIQFAEETEDERPESSWKILIVDDEAEVHEITKLALDDVTFEGRSLSFISAYSARQAKALTQAYPDIAIIFLDVVMETEDAGLALINYVRTEQDNSTTRIILRTGQPGQAPEDIVVVNYGIDDYKTKTELTARKLLISVITALRTYSVMVQMLEQAAQDSPAAGREGQMGQLAEKLRSRQGGGAGAIAGPLHTMSMVSRIARMVLRIMDGQSTQLGISQSKLAVLMYLSSEPEGTSPSTLAKHCGVSRAAMTGLLDGLTQDSYVERTVHPSDRRALRVKLTPAGRHFLEQIGPQQVQMSELMESLDPTERQTLMELMMRFIRVLDEQPEPAHDSPETT